MATNDKYDRQLRVWGPNGQKALMESSVLLINADAAGSETLKNLVLPGIGSFTIVDDKLVESSDLGNNFFVTVSSIGQPRAEVVCTQLCEMNGDVKGIARVESIDRILDSDIKFLQSFQLIVISNACEDILWRMSEVCSASLIPLVSLSSVGFLGSVRLQYRYHTIIEARSDADIFDLRIVESFPELKSYCDTFELDSLDSLEHRHVPYVIILVKALSVWRQQRTSSNDVPKTAAEKDQFRSIIKSMSTNISEEQNFHEALTNCYRVFSEKSVHQMPDLLSLLKTYSAPDWKSSSLSGLPCDFDIILLALVQYLGFSQDETGVCTTTSPLPLSGQLPDMTATTISYIGLQECYHQRGAADRNRLADNVRAVLAEYGFPDSNFDWNSIDLVVKNLHGLKAIDTSSISTELQVTCDNGVVDIIQELASEPYDDPAQTPILWYVAMRAANLFRRKYKRWPGSVQERTNLDEEQSLLWQEMVSYLENIGASGIIGVSDEMGSEEGSTARLTSQYAAELVRYGGVEVHPISAIIGGMAAQEVVKLITHQYTPLQSTYIFNGIAGCGLVLPI